MTERGMPLRYGRPAFIGGLLLVQVLLLAVLLRQGQVSLSALPDMFLLMTPLSCLCACAVGYGLADFWRMRARPEPPDALPEKILAAWQASYQSGYSSAEMHQAADDRRNARPTVSRLIAYLLETEQARLVADEDALFPVETAPDWQARWDGHKVSYILLALLPEAGADQAIWAQRLRDAVRITRIDTPATGQQADAEWQIIDHQMIVDDSIPAKTRDFRLLLGLMLYRKLAATEELIPSKQPQSKGQQFWTVMKWPYLFGLGLLGHLGCTTLSATSLGHDLIASHAVLWLIAFIISTNVIYIGFQVLEWLFSGSIRLLGYRKATIRVEAKIWPLLKPPARMVISLAMLAAFAWMYAERSEPPVQEVTLLDLTMLVPTLLVFASLLLSPWRLRG